MCDPEGSAYHYKDEHRSGDAVVVPAGRPSPEERDIAVFNPKPFLHAMWAMFSQPIMTQT